MAKATGKQTVTLTSEQREDLGKWARRLVQSVREFEKEAGRTIPDEELRPWGDMTEEDREIYRKGGEAVTGGVLPSDQMFLDQLACVRAEMGEKAFRQKVFSICIDITVERLAPQLSELDHYKAVEAIMGLSGMLEVPPELGQS